MKLLLSVLTVVSVFVFSLFNSFAAVSLNHADLILPNTGDTMKPFIFLGVAVIAIAVVVACVIIPMKNKKKSELNENISEEDANVSEDDDSKK